MKTRKKTKGCPNCGGTKTVVAIDNFGKPYIGYACCRILSLEEIEAILKKGQPAPT